MRITKRGLSVVFVVAAGSILAAQQLQSIAVTIADRLNAGTVERKIAVVDLVDLQGRPTELGRYLAEELSVALAGSAKKFVVIDRSHLQALLQEHKLSASGLVDPQTARKLGELAGADTLITGTVTPFGDTVRVSVKAIDVQTAALLTATAGDLPRTRAIEELLGRSAGSSGSGEADRPVAAKPRTASGQALGNVKDLARRQSTHGIVFELNFCRQSGTEVTCDLKVVSQQADEELWISQESKAFDDRGHEHHAKAMVLANKKGSSRMGPTARLIQGVPTHASLTFEDVPSDADSFSLVEMLGAVGSSGRFTATFRNVRFE